MLFNEPKLLKSYPPHQLADKQRVSVLFNEPKLLKSAAAEGVNTFTSCFSALQRAEIAEIRATSAPSRNAHRRFSALQRAEIAEIQ